MIDHIKRLQSKGGRIVSELIKDHEIGYVGANGKGKSEVRIAFYPDHTYERLEGGKKIRAGWKEIVTDLDKLAKDSAKAEKEKKAQEKELKFGEKIRVTEKEFLKICKASGVSLGGDIADMWPYEDTYDYETVNGEERELASCSYSVALKNPEWTGEDDDDNEEFLDTIYITLTRDGKNPDKIHADDANN